MMLAIPSIATGAILLAISLTSSVVAAASHVPPATLTVKNNHPLIYYHGRWDSDVGTWWPGSGFKIKVKNLKSLTLNLGPKTPYPSNTLGVSIGDSEFFPINGSAGANTIPLPASLAKAPRDQATTVRINAAGWQTYRMQLDNITLNSDALLVPYTPSKTVFQIIGDSFSSGYLMPFGADQSWPFLVGEAFKAEHRITAQAGAALTDIVSYGNAHGLSYQFFKTEDTGYYYTTDHNYTTPWNFARDQPPPTHVVIHIGANDAAQGVSNDQFVQVYSDFLVRIRKLYPHQPIFMFTPWGWPSSDGNVYYYYQGLYQQILDARVATGDKNIFLVDTTGWITWDDVFPDSLHPTVAGQAKVANNFLAFLKDWGLVPPPA
ncbi:SGNH hydrolase [Agrocybe pediades]|nr:SGNH hydrolase [Agrocybe pediades]